MSDFGSRPLAPTVGHLRIIQVRFVVLLALIGSLVPLPEVVGACAPTAAVLTPRPFATATSVDTGRLEWVSHVDAVFRGRVVAIVPEPSLTPRTRDVTFAVSVVWKGPVAMTITARYQRDEGQCEGGVATFVENNEYLVFAGYVYNDLYVQGQPVTALVSDAANTLAALGPGTVVGASASPAVRLSTPVATQAVTSPSPSAITATGATAPHRRDPNGILLVSVIGAILTLGAGLVVIASAGRRE